MSEDRPPCRHCGRRKPARQKRGLCFACYHAPGVRDQYPSGSKYARLGVGNGNKAAPLPKVPTRATPGTEQKLLVMEERAERGEQLFHPEDGL